MSLYGFEINLVGGLGSGNESQISFDQIRDLDGFKSGRHFNGRSSSKFIFKVPTDPDPRARIMLSYFLTIIKEHAKTDTTSKKCYF